MKRIPMMLLSAGIALALITACTVPTTAAQSAWTGTQTTALPVASVETSVPAAAEGTVDPEISKRDASGDYDADAAVSLSSDSDLTITEAGVYLLTGTVENRMITVDAGDDDKVQIVLSDATISNAEGPAIYVKNANKVFLTAAEGTENVISDGADYTLTDGDTSVDAAVFSKDDLTINGSGALTIHGNQQHGVVSKDDLVVTASNLTVTAASAALTGKDSVKLVGASVVLTVGTDGIRSTNDADAERGFISLFDSTVSIDAQKDGIQAETAFVLNSGELTVTAGSGIAARSYDSNESYKGIKHLWK